MQIYVYSLAKYQVPFYMYNWRNKTDQAHLVASFWTIDIYNSLFIHSKFLPHYLWLWIYETSMNIHLYSKVFNL